MHSKFYQNRNVLLCALFSSPFLHAFMSYLINMHEEDFSENINFIKETEKVLDENKEFDVAFICASGARSEIVANYFIEKNYKNIFHIPEGILGKNKDGWLFLGYPIESYINK